MEVRPGYKRTEVGVIPEEWEVRTIGRAMRLINGRVFKSAEWKQQGIPIIRIQNLNDRESSFNYCDTPVGERHHIGAGDILFAWSGTTGTSFGARIWGGPNGVLNQHIFKVMADARTLTPIYSFLILQRVQEDIEKQAHGFKTSFVHVKKSDLVKVPLPVPPLPEQRAIAVALADIDALLDALARLIAKKRDLKQAAMQQLLTGQTRLPGFSGEWEVKQLGDVAEIVSGGTPRTSVPSYWDGGIRWCTPTDITGTAGKYLSETARTISQAGLENCSAHLLPTGALLLCTRATIGDLKIAACDVCTNQGFGERQLS